jgi:hypothetical protein
MRSALLMFVSIGFLTEVTAMGTHGRPRRRHMPIQVRNGVITCVLVDPVHSWLASTRALRTMSAFSGTTPTPQTNEMYSIAR